jgi:uncharacterized membrane protein YeaQ/YmgE (transglycosylase-associated protein family)
MGLIIWVVVGAGAGLAARRIVPGPDPGRSFVTVLLGMAGASLGGFVVSALSRAGPSGFSLWSVPVATVSALGVLYLYGLVARRTT